MVTFSVMPLRMKSFNKKFLSQFIPDVKTMLNPSDTEAMALKKIEIGYPDVGCGRFSERLDHKDWVLFNASIRSGRNYLEFYWLYALNTIAAGLFLPKTAGILCLLIVFGRALFKSEKIGYKQTGIIAMLRKVKVTLIPYGALLYMLYITISSLFSKCNVSVDFKD